MVDTTGAVDLSLRATDIVLPDSAVLRSADLRRVAEEAAFGLPPSVWLRFQFTRLAAASVLEARLLHVRSARLGFFGLVADPSRVTLQQLAPLHLEHNGTAGQAFELAVADAIAAEDEEVTSMVRAGLRHLNLTAEGPLRMVVLGMEKVPLERREAFWDEVRSVVPSDGKFRTGMPGRPANAATAIDRLAASTTQTLRFPRELHGSRLTELEVRDRYSQLARADALVTCGSDLVAAQLKINSRHAHGQAWRDVPMWITAGPHGKVSGHRTARSPRVVVTLPADGWFSVFRDALEAVDIALHHINRDTALSARTTGPWDLSWVSPNVQLNVGHAVAKLLWTRRTETVAEVAARLRETHPAVVDAAELPRRQIGSVDLTSLNVPSLLQGWDEESASGRLFTQEHLFRHLTPRERVIAES